jgi:RNA 2',3'-cyclic 3'-phosphodiesterase
MRLFVAMLPPGEVIADLEHRAAPLRAAWPGLRWTGREAWHVTLAFLGEVSQDVVPDLSTRLERAAGHHQTQDLAVQGGGAFPGAGRARVVWAGLRADQRALTALAGSVAAGARRAGAPSPDEDRRYRPHITLARLREPADVRALITSLADLAGPPWTATQIHLIHSHPPALNRPPVYTTLASWPLR